MKKSIILIILFLIISGLLTAQVKETRTDWNSIKNSEGNITLNFVKTWRGNLNGGMDSLLAPNDICVDKEGNYYLLDNCIFVYDKNGKLKKKIGKRSQGKGPGEFSFAPSIDIDDQGNLAVGEYLKERVQLIYKDNSIKIISFPNVEYGKVSIDEKNRLVLQGSLFEEGAAKLLIYDYSGKLLGSVGKIKSLKDENGNPDRTEYLYHYCTDKEGNYYISYQYLEPVIEKYSPEGKLVMKLNYELITPHGKPRKKGVIQPDEIIPSMPQSLAVDIKGNIYVVALKKAMTYGDERNPEIRDGYYQLIVFDKNGNLKGSKALPFFAGKIKIYGNYLFIHDSKEYAIHQYNITN